MIQWWQILLLTLYSAYQICDELTIVSSAGSPVFAGFITGLIMGDVTTGLLIGGNLQLFVLGVGTFGGASRIDATSGAVLATAFSVSQGIDGTACHYYNRCTSSSSLDLLRRSWSYDYYLLRSPCGCCNRTL